MFVKVYGVFDIRTCLIPDLHNALNKSMFSVQIYVHYYRNTDFLAAVVTDKDGVPIVKGSFDHNESVDHH